MTRSDTRNKEIALGRIKRIASSGLPLEPFVRSIFDLINDAVPSSPNKNFMIGGSRADTYIGSTPEANEVVPIHRRYFAETRTEASGSKLSFDGNTLRHVFTSKTIWMHEEIAQADFYRTEGFNAVFRPMGFHHSMVAVFQEAGEFLGYYPLWRGVDQKTFSSNDVAFLRASASHISHGLGSARFLAGGSRVEKEDSFAPLGAWTSGVILLDEIGHPIAMDAAARLTFQQMGIFEGISSDAFSSPPIKTALDYVMRTLKEIFHEPDAGSFTGPAPVYRLYQHWTGIVLKLRGIRMTSLDGREYTTVLVERGETIAAKQRRLQFRWGLSDREAEVLALIAQGKTGPEISILLSIAHDTASKHLTHVFEKLGVENRTEAALIARDAS
jgi:DNA-binding CsgD family transcriptional regulator